jgi:hypothetical protein
VGISCTLRLLGSDSIKHAVTLSVLPRQGEVMFLGNTKNIIHSIEHVINPETGKHDVYVNYASEGRVT